MKPKAAIREFALFAVAAVLTAMPVLSQTPAPAKKPSFEVASVKPKSSGNFAGDNGVRGDSFTMSSISLRQLLDFAYRGNMKFLLNNQILGAPSWIESDRFEVRAKADCSGGPILQKQIQLMVQSLLEDRFRLKAHMEPRDLPIYELIIGKDGPKIKRSEDQTPTATLVDNADHAPRTLCTSTSNSDGGQKDDPFAPPPNPLPRGMTAYTPGETRFSLIISGAAVPIATLIDMIRAQAGRQIIDKTGLTGLYDFKLQIGPDSPGPAETNTLPPLLVAIQQQIGRKLESTKGPVDVLVIDSVQKPTEN